MSLSRRQFSLSALAAAAPAPEWMAAPPRAIATDGSAAPGCRVERRWQGRLCRARVTNRGKNPVALREIVLFEGNHGCGAETPIYGEGFTMLSQTGGTIAAPAQIGNYTDRKHYKIPEPADATTLYNLLCLSPAGQPHTLLAFTSSRRWVGRFHLRASTLQVTLDCEGLTLGPGESWTLEEFCRLEGADRPALFAELGHLIAAQHRPLAWPAPPEGWCSWYCFGPRVTAQRVTENLEWIAANARNLRYIQIDDGYQPAMGDWLETGTAFGGEIRAVLREIRQRGFEPAIWVAPFIAEEKSHLFAQHPDWFMKDAGGQPLPSNKVTFGGWRRGPWYALDGTHPGARNFLESVFRTMNREWGVTYFKLDAIFWGAMHSARLHDSKATRVEAYRLGMQSIIRGAGKSFILGCNHPLWPSLGVIHGSRSSGDISRNWKTVKSVAAENLHRAWQNQALWWNDPDALVLMGALPENEFGFHAAATYATGGMLLSGDDLTRISPARKALLDKLRPTRRAAQFTPNLQTGRMRLEGREMLFAMNWEDAPARRELTLPAGTCQLTDYFTGAALGTHRGVYRIDSLPARSALVIEVRPL
ncbi:MAG: alpha-galactosidase [Acidobacteria bacterium]|nr:alpha-galactosidase [Acidobacteriota bacterium]